MRLLKRRRIGFNDFFRLFKRQKRCFLTHKYLSPLLSEENMNMNPSSLSLNRRGLGFMTFLSSTLRQAIQVYSTNIHSRSCLVKRKHMETPYIWTKHKEGRNICFALLSFHMLSFLLCSKNAVMISVHSCSSKPPLQGTECIKAGSSGRQ